MDHSDEPALACPYMTSPIDLLRDFPRRGSGVRGGPLAERLDGLEYDARRNDAPSGTIGAIRGVRVLLDLAAWPPVPAPRTPRSRGRVGAGSQRGSVARRDKP